MNKKLINWSFYIFLLSVFAVSAGIFSLFTGSAEIPFGKIFSLLFTRENTTEYSIIFDIRLPRIILGFAAGSALSLSGVILQGMFRNPLVEPYTLGISGGAALGVCLNIIFKINKMAGFWTLPFSGFIGAGLIIFCLYLLSSKKGIVKIHDLLLYGIMVSFISSSLLMFLMAVSRSEDLQKIIFWMMGSLDETNWDLIYLMALVSFLGLVISYFYSADLNAFVLGEEDARHLGIDTEKVKKYLFLLTSILVGACVSIAGTIGFVGLVIPHLVRLIAGRDFRIVLVSSYLAGGAFLILCDTLARTVISPLELPVGVITGIIGGGLFIYVFAGMQRTE
ncbi:MAG: iron ABC transporter permease [bacterium]